MAKTKVVLDVFSDGRIQISLNDGLNLMRISNIKPLGKTKNDISSEYRRLRDESSQKVLQELNQKFICKACSPSNTADPTFIRWEIDSFTDSKFKNEKPTANEATYIAQKIATKFKYDFECQTTPELTERLKQMGIR